MRRHPTNANGHIAFEAAELRARIAGPVRRLSSGDSERSGRMPALLQERLERAVLRSHHLFRRANAVVQRFLE